MSSSPAPVERLTVDQLIASLQEQSAHGRGDHQVVILPTGGRRQFGVRAGFASGLPEEMGERVGVYVVPE